MDEYMPDPATRISRNLRDNKKMIIERVAYAVRCGASLEHACYYGGIDKRTFLTWLVEEEQKGDNSTYLSIKTAEADAVMNWLGMLEVAGQQGTWQAAAWLLERRHPEHYGKRTRLEHTGANGAPIQVEHKDYSKLSDEELDLMILQRQRQLASESDSDDTDIIDIDSDQAPEG